jgi:hypothetical protein
MTWRVSNLCQQPSDRRLTQFCLGDVLWGRGNQNTHELGQSVTCIITLSTVTVQS